MARIQTLEDLEKADKEQQRGDSERARDIRFIVPFPSPESPLTARSLLECMFPKFSWKHSVFIFTIIDIIVYIATVAYERAPGSFLSPSMMSLQVFGASIPVAIRNGQVWRLICSIFLHSGIFHLLINAYMQIRIGAPLEEKYGTLRICVAYLICGICGNLISAAAFFCNVLKVGASTAGFGLVGIQLAEVAVLWGTVEDKRPIITQLIVFAVLFIAFSLGGSIDVVGHIGGMLVGISCGLSFNLAEPQGLRRLSLYAHISYTALAVGLCLSALAIWVLPRKCA